MALERNHRGESAENDRERFKCSTAHILAGRGSRVERESEVHCIRFGYVVPCLVNERVAATKAEPSPGFMSRLICLCLEQQLLIFRVLRL